MDINSTIGFLIAMYLLWSYLIFSYAHIWELLSPIYLILANPLVVLSKTKSVIDDAKQSARGDFIVILTW